MLPTLRRRVLNTTGLQHAAAMRNIDISNMIGFGAKKLDGKLSSLPVLPKHKHYKLSIASFCAAKIWQKIGLSNH